MTNFQTYLENALMYVIPLISIGISILSYRSSNLPAKIIKQHRHVIYSYGVMDKNLKEIKTGNKCLLVFEILVQNLKPKDISFFDLSVTDQNDCPLLYLSESRLGVFSEEPRGLLAEMDRVKTIVPLRLPHASFGVLPSGQVSAIQLVFGINDDIPEKINVSLKLPQYFLGLIPYNKRFKITQRISEEQLMRFTNKTSVSFQDVINSIR